MWYSILLLTPVKCPYMRVYTNLPCQGLESSPPTYGVGRRQTRPLPLIEDVVQGTMCDLGVSLGLRLQALG